MVTIRPRDPQPPSRGQGSQPGSRRPEMPGEQKADRPGLALDGPALPGEASMHDTLSARYRVLKTTEPALRARDAAERLGISEGALLATRMGDGEDIRPLTLKGADFARLIEGLREVGPVM